MQLLGIKPRMSPSEHVEQQWPTFADKAKINLPPEDFSSEPVTDIEREILRLAPRGMLYDLNKQALDRELNNLRFMNAVRQAKPKMM
jgi:hypothetical protein